MRILVTGGSGMVGKNLIQIIPNKYNILAPSKNELDLRDYKKVINYLNKKKPKIIIHLASLVGGIQANINNPVEFLQENLLINLNIIKAANKSNIKQFLNIASSCIYPKNIKSKLREEMLLSGKLEETNEGYALSKIASMKLCEYISLDKNRSYKTLIPCNLYGEHDNFNETSSHLVAAIIKKIHFAKLNKKKTVTIWGDGKAKREFLFVSDFVNFILFVIKNFKKVPNIMNVGSGKDYAIKDYYKFCAEIAKYDGKFKFDKTKPVGLKKKLLDISRQNQLSWKPKTKIKDGIRKTYDFYMKQYE
jgi:nucleoside-diphosphate-sugar epimerase